MSLAEVPTSSVGAVWELSGHGKGRRPVVGRSLEMHHLFWANAEMYAGARVWPTLHRICTAQAESKRAVTSAFLELQACTASSRIKRENVALTIRL